MKTAACIICIIWSLLLLEPLSANLAVANHYETCAKAEPARSSCCESVCKKAAEEQKERDCTNNSCNPLMSCTTGNFYLSGHSDLTIAVLAAIKVVSRATNDNRIIKQQTKCWHPPEII